jgi:DNA invertase Pin-like site-specific DNA recombinase
MSRVRVRKPKGRHPAARPPHRTTPITAAAPTPESHAALCASAEPCISYYRVSTKKQGKSGLGLEAQRHAVRDHVSNTGRKLIYEFTEIESGKHPDRRKLAEALRLCRLTGAKLVVARLDRLARNVSFVSRVMESGVAFEAVDFPQANRFTVHVIAAMAEYELRLISERIKAGLAAAKARGIKLGGFRGGTGNLEGLAKGRAVRSAKAAARAADLAGVIADIRASGFVSHGLIARELNARGIFAPRGGPWSGSVLKPVLQRLSVGMTVQESLRVRRGTKSDWISSLAPVIAEIQASGFHSARAIAAELNARGLSAYRGGRWFGCEVRRLLMHLPPGQWRPLYEVRREWLEQLAPVIADIQQGGYKLPGQIARELNAREVPALLGGRWRGDKVRQTLAQLSGRVSLAPSKEARSTAMTAWVAKIAPVVRDIRRSGATSATAIAGELNRRGEPAYLGGTWGRCQVRLLMMRMAPAARRRRSA